jgi:sortase (surface protein transpeptidase)
MTRRWVRLAAVGSLAVLVGCSRPAPAPDRALRPGDRPSTAPSPIPTFHSVRQVAAVAAPVRLEIPAIGVRTSLVTLGRNADGTVEVPGRWEVAGWYSGGARPGQPGAAVILGHVDSARYGPAVFYRLRELRPGDAVIVWRQDGSRARFTVNRVASFNKSRFPTDQVYYPTVAPELRLVTCGGLFDRAARNYLSNIIAFATLQD